MRAYELMYVVNPGIGGDEEYAAFAERINTMITSHGGSLVTGGEPNPILGRRKLAYPIRADGRDLTRRLLSAGSIRSRSGSNRSDRARSEAHRADYSLPAHQARA